MKLKSNCIASNREDTKLLRSSMSALSKINEFDEPDFTINLQKYYYDRSSNEIKIKSGQYPLFLCFQPIFMCWSAPENLFENFSGKCVTICSGDLNVVYESTNSMEHFRLPKEDSYDRK